MHIPDSLRRATALGAAILGAALWSACSDRLADGLTGPSQPQLTAARADDVRRAIAVQERHTDALMRIPGVVGTAVGLLPDGRAAVQILIAHRDVPGLPAALDNVPVALRVTGQLVAFSDPTTRQRPAPVGFSVGHPAITAGTIGYRVRDGAGNMYVLSNNHVLANSNDAAVGDPTLQPGAFDGGTAADQIGTLFAFKPIDFTTGGANTFDGAIALTTAAEVGNATPADDGYGSASPAIYGDADADGAFDDKAELLGVNVQKYGRTTKRTHGQITGINATVDICYEVLIFFCIKSARFVDQIIIEPGTFSGGGDSGSLIVSDDANNNPIALLFAGSSAQTIANRIDLVLSHFGVSIDAGEAPPPTPLTDVAIAGVTAPASVTQGGTAAVVVTVRNVGNQDVSAGIDVTLDDATDATTIGTQTVPGLAAGAVATVSFDWNTTGSTTGQHTLTARHAFTDENAANDLRSVTVSVNAPGTAGGIHVGDLDGIPSSSGSSWAATVEITMHDENHNPLSGAAIVGAWSVSGLNSNECTTGDLGGDGTCIVLFPSLKKGTRFVTFTVTSVTMAERTYIATENHDVDGSSTGTVIRVDRP